MFFSLPARHALGLLVLWPGAVWSQEVEMAGEFRQFGRIEITGSSIINPRAREVLPVKVLDRKAIERSGAQDAAQLLQALPMMYSFNEVGGYNQTGKGGYQSGAIHGYEDGTLVLINGRRIAQVPKQRADVDRSTSDLSLLPLNAIESVEILTDGASSLYGSDAIAGVVNFITRQSVKGLQAFAEKTINTGLGGDGHRVGLSWGTQRLAGHDVQFQIHLELQKRDAVIVADRAAANLIPQDFGTDAQSQPLRLQPYTSAYDLPGILWSQQQGANCPETYAVVRSHTGRLECQSAPYRALTLYPSSENQRIHSQFEHHLDMNHTVYGEWSWQQQAYAYRRILLQQSGYIYTGSDYVLFNMEPLNPVQRHQRNHHQRTVLGQKGQWDDWHYNLSLTDSRQRFTDWDTGGFVSTAWPTLLNDHAAELLNPAATYSSALQELIASRRDASERLMRGASTGVQEMQATASSSIGETRWGEVQLGLVGFLQRQTFSTESPAYPSTEPSFSASRKNTGLAAELRWPAWQSLDLTASTRVEHYSDFGLVTTGKLGAKYALTDQRFIRASAGTGFRAPTLAQMSAQSWRVSISPNVYEVFATGNPSLQPEKSNQWIIGLHDQLTPYLFGGADLWRLDIRDSFGSWSQAQIVNDPALMQRYYSVSSNGLGRYDLVTINTGRSQRMGIDYYLHHRWPLASGRLITRLDGTHNLLARKSTSPDAPLLTTLGIYQPGFTELTPRNKWTLSTLWETAHSGWRVALNVMSGNQETYPKRFVVSADGSDVGNSYSHQVPTSWTLDVGGWYEWHPKTLLRWAVRNLTDRAAPQRFMKLGADGLTSAYPASDTRYNDYYGRTAHLMLEWKL